MGERACASAICAIFILIVTHTYFTLYVVSCEFKNKKQTQNEGNKDEKKKKN